MSCYVRFALGMGWCGVVLESWVLLVVVCL